MKRTNIRSKLHQFAAVAFSPPGGTSGEKKKKCKESSAVGYPPFSLHGFAGCYAPIGF